MIITDKYIYVHTRKCAGTVLTEFLAQLNEAGRTEEYKDVRIELPDSAVSGGKVMDPHICAWQIPYHDPNYKDKVIFTTIRNPWDWYVSWHFYFKEITKMNGNIPSTPHQINVVLTEKIRKQKGYDPAVEDALIFRAWMKNLLTSPPGWENSQIENIGFCTFLHVTTCFSRLPVVPEPIGVRGGLTFENLPDKYDEYMRMERPCKTEFLKEEVLRIFNKCGIEADMNALDSIPAEYRNASKHEHYSHYYDDEIRDLVREKDGFLIERYNYEFEKEQEKKDD